MKHRLFYAVLSSIIIGVCFALYFYYDRGINNVASKDELILNFNGIFSK
ncbi:hypothetical protein KW797_01565 [Candidatus Parcubacteria bacterium]|nr:hypothetical protein [Candidatus Parcubacteria bacterium]